MNFPRGTEINSYWLIWAIENHPQAQRKLFIVSIYLIPFQNEVIGNASDINITQKTEVLIKGCACGQTTFWYVSLKQVVDLISTDNTYLCVHSRSQPNGMWQMLMDEY